MGLSFIVTTGPFPLIPYAPEALQWDALDDQSLRASNKTKDWGKLMNYYGKL